MALITHQGISAAIANLRPNPATLKGRLISLIHSYCPTDERLAEIDSIPADDLIRQLWEVDDPAEIHQKKKNLSSLKSSINKDLKNLARQGKNPEGLIISRDNVFTISDEHKDDLLQKLGLSSALAPKDILTLMRGILDSVMQGDGRKEAASLLKEIDKTREMIARAAGMGDASQHLAPGTGIGDAAAGTPVDGAAVAETVTAGDGGGSAAPAILAGDELAGAGTDTGAELPGGAEDGPAALELLDQEEVELLDEAEVLEQETVIADETTSAPPDGLARGELAGAGTDTETEGAGGNEAGPAIDEWLADEEFDLLNEAEILEQETKIAGDIIGGPDDGPARGGLAGAETDTETEGAGGNEAGPAIDEWLADEEFDLLDETEITDTGADLPGGAEDGPAALELLDQEEVELLDEAEVLEQETVIAGDIIGGPDDGMAGAGTDAGADLPGGAEDGPAALELLDEAEVLEQETEIAGDIIGGPDDGMAGGGLAGTGTDAGAGLPGGAEDGPAALELLDQEEVELLDEAKVLEQETVIAGDIIGGPDDGMAGGGLAGTGTDTGAGLPGGAEDGPAALELLDQEEVELLDEAEILEQETVIAGETTSGPDDGLAGGGLAGTGTDAGAGLPGGAEDGPAALEFLDQEEVLLNEAEILEQETKIAGDIIGGPDDGPARGGLAGAGTDTGAGLPGDGEDGPAALELLDQEEVELLDEAEILEQETVIAGETTSAPADGLAGGELAGAGTDAGAGLPGDGEDGPAALELLDQEEVELLDEAEILEQETVIAGETTSAPADGLAGGELAGAGTDAGAGLPGDGEDGPAALELLDQEEVELLDEAEVLEQETEIAGDIIGGPDDGMAGGGLAGTGTDTGAGLPGGAEDGPAALELLDQEEVELLDEAEILEQETEIIDEEETTTIGEIGETDAGQRAAARPLDLSHYIEPDEALASPPETLTESHDDYIAQILERFMPKFIKIPAGYYPTGRDQPSYNERPARKIFLQSFYIAQLPVTNDLFDFFVRETGYETDAERAGFGNVVEGRVSNRIDPDTGRTVLSINRGTSSQRTQGANWRHPAGPGSALENKGNHPVVQVSRQDALAFAAWAGKRLPGEDEWEAAARGPAGLLFPWGNKWQGELANTEAALTGDTTPVIRHGKPSMSPFGVYDLLGNVFEWTASVHTPSRPVSNRTPPVYVLKGGCWTSKAGITMAARLLEPDTWSNIIGFRCAV